MFSVFFIFKIFMVITIIITNLTSLSAGYLLMKMVKNNDDYETYHSRTTKSYERNLDMDEFYETIHNFEHRRYPNPLLENSNYDKYVSRVRAYCKDEYVTYEYFIKSYKLIKFKKNIISLNSCLNGEVLNEHLKYCTNNAAQLQTKKSGEYFNNAEKEISKCLRIAIPNKNQEKLFASENEEIDCDDLEFDEKKLNNEFAEILLNCLENRLQSSYLYGKFVSCMTSFKEKTLSFTAYTKIDEISVKDVLFAKALIEQHFEIDDINYDYLYVYNGGKKVIITSDDKLKCESNTLPLDSTQYSTLCNYAKNIQNQSRLNTRRAFGEENDYASYVVRINSKKYFPLPKILWKDERKISEYTEVINYINEENTADLEDENKN